MGGFSLPDPRRRGAAGPESPPGESLWLFQPFPQPVASTLEPELACSWATFRLEPRRAEARLSLGAWIEQPPAAPLQPAGVGGQL